MMTTVDFMCFLLSGVDIPMTQTLMRLKCVVLAEAEIREFARTRTTEPRTVSESSSADEHEEEELKETKQPIKRKVKVPSTNQVKDSSTVKKRVKVRVPSKFLKHVKKGTVKKNYKIRVPSTFLKKNQSTLAKRKLKVRIPSKFLKKRAVVKKVNDTNTMVKKKLKVRIPSKFLKKVVKKKVKVSSKVFKKNLVKLRKKKKVAKESECPTSQKKSSSTLSAVKRLVRLKRKAKVHPITSTK